MLRKELVVGVTLGLATELSQEKFARLVHKWKITSSPILALYPNFQNYEVKVKS